MHEIKIFRFMKAYCMCTTDKCILFVTFCVNRFLLYEQLVFMCAAAQKDALNKSRAFVILRN